jgi:hypothetical protein
VPKTLKYTKWANKRVKHNSSHKLAYLHPNHFNPNSKILKKYSLKNKEYIIVRKSALKAHHDIGAKGIEKSLWEKLEPHLKNWEIIDSKEGINNKNVDFFDMHDLLYYAKLLICDSQTMSMEAGILGTPCIRISTFKGKLSYLEELENKYGLLFSYKPDQHKQILEKAEEILLSKDIEKEFQTKRAKMLEEKGDFTDWMIEFFEKNKE